MASLVVGPGAVACGKAGDVDGLARLERGALGAVDRFGSNALHWAAGAGHLACVAWLVEGGGLDPSAPATPPVAGDAPTTRGRTPLHFAARNGRAAVVRYLCGLPGVDADARAFRGVSPLQLAVWRNHGAVARALADDFGADVGQRNDVGCGPAHWLAIAPPGARAFPPPPPPGGTTGAVARALADDFGADVGQRNDLGCGLAHWLAIALPAAGPFPPPPPPVGLLRPPRAKGSLYMWLRL